MHNSRHGLSATKVTCHRSQVKKERFPVSCFLYLTSSSRLKSLSSRLGQTAIQYILIAALVSAGIIIGGPYVIRSWNANIKTLEDSVTDSYQDPLDEADPFDYDQDCECQDWSGEAPNQCGVGGCGDFQVQLTRLCTPLGCNPNDGQPLERCVSDSSCCNQWEQLDCSHLLGSIDHGCQNGDMVHQRLCNGGRDAQYFCEPNHGRCAAECIGVDESTPPPAKYTKGWCEGAFDNVVGKNPVTYTDRGTCETGVDIEENQCVAECLGVSLPEGRGCECSDILTEEIYNEQADVQEQQTFNTNTITLFNPPTPITVDVFSENLNFDVKFYDVDGKVIDWTFCKRNSFIPNNLTLEEEVFVQEREISGNAQYRLGNGHLQGDCGPGPLRVQTSSDRSHGRIDHFTITHEASYVWVRVKERDTQSPEFGWRITTNNCCNTTDKVTVIEDHALDNFAQWMGRRVVDEYLQDGKSLPGSDQEPSPGCQSASLQKFCEEIGYTEYVAESAVTASFRSGSNNAVFDWDSSVGPNGEWILNSHPDQYNCHTTEFACSRQLPINKTNHLVMVCDDDAYKDSKKLPYIKGNYDFSTGTICESLPGDNDGVVCDTTGNVLAGPEDGGDECPNLDVSVPVQKGDIIVLDSAWTRYEKGSVEFFPGPSCSQNMKNISAPFLNEAQTYIDIPCDGNIVNHMIDDNIATILMRPSDKCEEEITVSCQDWQKGRPNGNRQLHFFPDASDEECKSQCEEYIKNNANPNEVWVCDRHTNGSCHKPVKVDSATTPTIGRGHCSGCRVTVCTTN